ncbi:MAG: class I SAM-dependent methyltransferase [Alphaproteobacteria bacterium]|nr:class I SAM-dependent methyltransferase [Alphaproteobacteria bacterium]
MILHGKRPDWYNGASNHYDLLHEETDISKITNATIEKILKQYGVKTVLDLTCGTGSQVFYLAKMGYRVTGSDISQGMLSIAEDKARAFNGVAPIKLLLGDMRTIKVGTFNAAITIFNAIGHLTKAGFEKAMRNISGNLREGGLYVFDIFNLNYLIHGDNITKLSIEWLRSSGNTKHRHIQHSIINDQGILTSYTTNYVQEGSEKPKRYTSIGTLQCYTAIKLCEMLKRNGFEVLGQYGMDGMPFSELETERLLTVARKR